LKLVRIVVGSIWGVSTFCCFDHGRWFFFRVVKKKYTPPLRCYAWFVVSEKLWKIITNVDIEIKSMSNAIDELTVFYKPPCYWGIQIFASSLTARRGVAGPRGGNWRTHVSKNCNSDAELCLLDKAHNLLFSWGPILGLNRSKEFLENIIILVIDKMYFFLFNYIDVVELCFGWLFDFGIDLWSEAATTTALQQ